MRSIACEYTRMMLLLMSVCVMLPPLPLAARAQGNTLWNWDGYGPNNNGGVYFETGRDTPWGKCFAFKTHQVCLYASLAPPCAQYDIAIASTLNVRVP